MWERMRERMKEQEGRLRGGRDWRKVN